MLTNVINFFLLKTLESNTKLYGVLTELWTKIQCISCFRLTGETLDRIFLYCSHNLKILNIFNSFVRTEQQVVKIIEEELGATTRLFSIQLLKQSSPNIYQKKRTNEHSLLWCSRYLTFFKTIESKQFTNQVRSMF